MKFEEIKVLNIEKRYLHVKKIEEEVDNHLKTIISAYGKKEILIGGEKETATALKNITDYNSAWETTPVNSKLIDKINSFTERKYKKN